MLPTRKLKVGADKYYMLSSSLLSVAVIHTTNKSKLALPGPSPSLKEAKARTEAEMLEECY